MAGTAPDDKAPCDALASCLAIVRTTAARGDGITHAEAALAKALRGFGRAAVPGLLTLLKDPDRDVRALAAYTLRDLEGLRETETVPLVDALVDGESWVAPALAHIATPAAIEGLFDELRRRPQPKTQVTWAFRQLGERGVPTLLRGFACPRACDEDLLSVITAIFDELGGQAHGAVGELTKIAIDPARPLPARQAAVASLGAIGPAASSAAPALQRLARTQPTAFGRPVQRALQGMKLPAGADGLAAQLASAPEVRLLSELAAMGSGGRSAGAAVLPLLNQKDGELRWAAARTLGYIGYSPAAVPLIAALRDDQDWRLVYAAAESLGRLRERSAVGALVSVSREHWYPPVREAARRAVAAIDGQEADVAKPPAADLAFELEFSAVERVGAGIPPCRSADQPREFSPPDDLSRAPASVRARPPRQRPTTALEVEDGWLLGADHGEWGGELVFQGMDGPQTIVSDNIQHLGRLGTRLIALGGLAHLFKNRGVAYQVTRNADGRWSARPWRVLPGAPTGSSVDARGRWLIHTHGGSVLLTPEGELSMTDCPR